jgi:hypothetical protein
LVLTAFAGFRMGYQCGFVVLVELPVQQADQVVGTLASGHGVSPRLCFEAMDPAKSPLLFNTDPISGK